MTIGWKEFFDSFSFDVRSRSLTRPGLSIRIDVARDSATSELIGYCICSVDDQMRGELESIYVEREYRSGGVGERLARCGLEWIDAQGADQVTIVVAVGNEDALPFYERLGFTPRTYRLKRHPREQEER
jgi:ribosomal protein S18 acetylase RimI-like enzyme